ncbi:DUF115 domain-containing protein [bacterium]|nr:DUF115 domain-containing protein [bacterium]
MYHKNLKLLENIDRELAKKVREVEEKIELIPTKEEVPTLKIEGVFLHSKYSPKKEAGRLIQGLSFAKAGPVIVLGAGLGYHLTEVLKRVENDSLLIIIEPNLTIFKAALGVLDLEDLLSFSSLRLAIGKNLEELADLLGGWIRPKDIKKPLLIPHPASLVLDREYYFKSKKLISDVITGKTQDFFTRINLENLWTKNIFANLLELAKSPGIRVLFSRFKDIPCFLVGAGPSLSKNGALLKQVKGKGLIICVDTALKPLLNLGVRPDICISLDAQRENFKDFEDLKAEDFLLVADATTYPAIIKEFNGPKLLGVVARAYHKDGKIVPALSPILLWLQDYIGYKGYLQSGGSVLTNAFDLARQMGCSPLIFVGCDLSYSKGKSHADGVSYIDEWLSSINKFESLEMRYRDRIKGDDLILISSYGGEGKVLTSKVLYSYLRWIVSAIPKVEMSCFNATEGGAAILGAKEIRLGEAIDRFCQGTKEAGKTLDEVLRLARQPYPVDLARLREGLSRKLGMVEELDGICRHAVRTASLLDRNWALKEKLNRLRLLDKEISERIKDVGFLDNTIQEVSFAIMRSAARDESQEKLIGQSLLLYQGVRGGCNYLKGLLEEAIKRVR